MLVIALLGIVAAVLAFAKTPAELRFRSPFLTRKKSLEEQLAACPADQHPVIIRGDWRRALRKDLLKLLPILPLAALALWLKLARGTDCAMLFGLTQAKVAVLFLYIGPPVLVGLVCVVMLPEATAALRTGYWPPLDRAVYVDTLARGGRHARLRALGLIASLLLLVAVCAWGFIDTVASMQRGGTWARLTAEAAACTRP